MATFSFSARDASGRTHSGELSADDSSGVVNELRGRGWTVLDVQAPASENKTASSRLGFSPSGWLRPTALDVEIGFQQISAMLRSGLTLLAAIKTAGEQARRPSMTTIWNSVYDRIEEGASFADALKAYPRYFPEYVVQLVRVGEASGALETVLTRAAEQLERSRNLKVQMLSALSYPAIVLTMAIGVTIFMILFLIPKLQVFFAGRHKRLPAITQFLLDISTTAQRSMPYVVVGLPLASVALWLFYRSPPGRMLIDRIMLRVPIIGKILRVSATAIFARTLGLLLESGVSLLNALEILEGLLTNRAMREHISGVRETVMHGGSLAAPLLQKGLFMPMLARMVAVGETTGALDPVLEEVAKYHEKELTGMIRRLSVLIEPAIIVVVGGIVGFVYIAFFLSLYSIAA